MEDQQADFATVYEALYGADHAPLARQLDYLSELFGAPPRQILDVGCGTGRHLLPLSELGYQVVGLDRSPGMLRVAAKRARSNETRVDLVLGDMRNLPFGPSMTGAVCLESPLAYLTDDSELAAALAGILRALLPASLLVIDVFDYVGALGTKPGNHPRRRYDLPQTSISVQETHTYDAGRQLWLMTQLFSVRQSKRIVRFETQHRLRIRTVDAYATALESAGFLIREILSCYPGGSRRDQDGPRFILVAERP